MPYLCFYFLPVEPGKEKDVLKSLQKDREKTIRRYGGIDFFKPFFHVPDGLLVRVEASSKKDARKFMNYLKKQEYVKDVVIRGDGLSY